jgi:hypothetical protein
MTAQNSPHTQTEHSKKTDQTDPDPGQRSQDSGEDTHDQMENAQTGADRTPRKLQTEAPSRNTEPETAAQEGSVTTRTPRNPRQGITSRSSEEESRGQEAVVAERPDARAGLNRSK